jgi:hypothetical protein
LDFCPLGSAEWPPSQNSLEFSPEELKMMRSSETPTLPESISIVADIPDPLKGKQIVVKSGNTGNRIIVEGYILPIEKTKITKEWEFITPKNNPRIKFSHRQERELSTTLYLRITRQEYHK